MITDANEPGRSPFPEDTRVTRSTSPPMVDGRKLETNMAAKECERSGGSSSGRSSTTSTRCQRSVASTTPAVQVRRPTANQASALGLWGSSEDRCISKWVPK